MIDPWPVLIRIETAFGVAAEKDKNRKQYLLEKLLPEILQSVKDMYKEDRWDD